MISINVNNSITQVTEDSSLAAVIAHFSVLTSGIAVAVNNTVIPKSNWESITVHANDNILIIQATQGG